MSDIVERLRNDDGHTTPTFGDLSEAANEIERNRETIAELVAALALIHDQPNCRYEVEAQLGDALWELITKYKQPTTEKEQ